MLAVLRNIRVARYIKSVLPEGFPGIELTFSGSTRHFPSTPLLDTTTARQYAFEKPYHKSTSTCCLSVSQTQEV